MMEEFDKEIDTLLRQAAQGVETVSNGQNLHLDADEINAFAENALPAKARFRTIEHLADCSRCRKILSDIIAFRSETKSEIVPLVEAKTISVPWYKRLFVFPQIAYVMGALALIFTGIVAVTVLQNSSDRNSSEIAQIEDKNFSETGSSADSLERMAANSSANSAMSANNPTGLVYSSNANTSAASPAETSRNKEAAITAATVAPTPAPEEDAPADKVADDKVAKAAPKPATPLNEESENAKKEKANEPAPVAAAPPPARSRENNYAVDGTSDSVSKQQAEQQPAQNSITQNQTTVMPDSRSARNVQNLPMNGRNTQSMQMKSRVESSAGSGAAKADKDEERKAETRAVGGKNFRRADGVWYDVKYKGQKTTNVARSSNDYKKLDGGLRSIADNLGGVVVILWKDKAYRIQ